MLDELLDRLKQGGLTVAVIDLREQQSTADPDSPAAQASKLMDWVIANEKTVRQMYTVLDKNGAQEKAESLKAWWNELIRPLHELGDQIPTDRDGSDPEADAVMVQHILDTATPIVECGKGVLAGIIARQIKAVTEIDFSDLII